MNETDQHVHLGDGTKKVPMPKNSDATDAPLERAALSGEELLMGVLAEPEDSSLPDDFAEEVAFLALRNQRRVERERKEESHFALALWALVCTSAIVFVVQRYGAGGLDPFVRLLSKPASGSWLASLAICLSITFVGSMVVDGMRHRSLSHGNGTC